MIHKHWIYSNPYSDQGSISSTTYTSGDWANSRFYIINLTLTSSICAFLKHLTLKFLIDITVFFGHNFCFVYKI